MFLLNMLQVAEESSVRSDKMSIKCDSSGKSLTFPLELLCNFWRHDLCLLEDVSWLFLAQHGLQDCLGST